MNRRDVMKAFVLGSATPLLLDDPAIAGVDPGGTPEERDLYGSMRAVHIYLSGTGATAGVPAVFVETVDGFPVDLVTRLELAIDASDMLFKGFITRIARDEVCLIRGYPSLRYSKDPKLVREPIVVLKFVMLTEADGPLVTRLRTKDLAYPIDIIPRSQP